MGISVVASETLRKILAPPPTWSAWIPAPPAPSTACRIREAFFLAANRRRVSQYCNQVRRGHGWWVWGYRQGGEQGGPALPRLSRRRHLWAQHSSPCWQCRFRSIEVPLRLTLHARDLCGRCPPRSLMCLLRECHCRLLCHALGRTYSESTNSPSQITLPDRPPSASPSTAEYLSRAPETSIATSGLL
jgi:hypothetical protein